MARLLLIDDEAGALTWMKAALEQAGHEVRTAMNATEALDAVRRAMPDLVLADILMPDLDGFELADRVQRAAPVAVMFVSIARREAEAILRGAAGYVHKPITAPELRAAVEHVLGRGSRDQTVLVVDDDPDVRDCCEMILRPAFRVLTATDGRDALDVLSRETVSLALVDVRMPVMNGVDLVRALRADARWRRLPVIVQTSDPAALRAPVWVDLAVDQVVRKDQFLQWLDARIESHVASVHSQPTDAARAPH
jgi:CheY-like chemotaxis protein